jgi:hypothetical protein
MNAKWLALQYLTNIKTGLLDLRQDPLLLANRKFYNLHNNKRCFILGSGHSIKVLDLTKLRNEIVITQNHFHSHEQIDIINPMYHVVVQKYQSTEYDHDWITWLKSMDEKLPKSTIMFFGKNTKYLVDELSLFKDRVYYIKTGYSPAILNKAYIDLSKTIMSVLTVLTECLCMAIYMGFKEIYLLGFDLDQICRQNDRAELRFYGLSPITSNKAEDNEEDYQLSSGLAWLYFWMIWRQCNLLKCESEKRNIKIINATKGGLLNVFERKNFEDVI